MENASTGLLLIHCCHFFSARLVIVAPVETVKTKVIELNKPFIEGLKYIVKNEGLAGVYQGVSTYNIARDQIQPGSAYKQLTCPLPTFSIPMFRPRQLL